ncbi:ferritin-like domain-containing protein [Nannocystaceae bacterium ST9]
MTRDHRLWKFRLRLLGAFGLGMLPGLVAAPVLGSSEQRTVECFELAIGQAECPGLEDAADFLDEGGTESGGWCTTEREVLGHAPAEDGTCCYAVSTAHECEDFDGEVFCGGCYGRPYVGDGGAVSAPVIERADWDADMDARPSLVGLSPVERAALAEFWSDAARAEHSSIAGFHRFALDLMAHAAPPDLLARAIQAAADELGHARDCFVIASHYAGRPLGPGPMPLGDAAPVAASLVELAVSTAREGCLSETTAAWVAGELASSATDPAVRATLDRIAREEAEHAELAWATLRWAIEVGGAEVRDAVAEVFANATPARLGGGTIDVPGHGLLAVESVQALVERGFRELLVPVMQAAMAA